YTLKFIPHLFAILIKLPPSSPPIPYTTLFRSSRAQTASFLSSTASASFDLPRLSSQRGDSGSDLHHHSSITTGTAVMTSTIRQRSEEHKSELQSRENVVCSLLNEKKKSQKIKV